MARFITKGRADPWSIPSPRRCHNRTIYGELQGLDYRRARSAAWTVFAGVVWTVAVLFTLKLWIVG